MRATGCRRPPRGRHFWAICHLSKLNCEQQVAQATRMNSATTTDRPRGSRQLRAGRHNARNQIYLVTSVTVRRGRLFASFKTGRILVAAMMEEHRAGHVESLAFVVMPDHFHWLLALTGEHELSTVIGRVKSRSSRLINRARERHGPVWQDGFHDHALRRDEDVADIARYVVANPLRAGLVSKFGDYPLWDAKWL